MKCLATLALLLSVFSWAESQIAQTEYGLVQGQTRTTETGQVYHSFESIPYARQPIGVLRFRDAIEPIAWRDMAPLNCTAQGPPFWGFHDGVIHGTFDALHVNVYTNNIAPTAAYPVMVFIHGGGWQSGSAGTEVYGPDFLVENNVTIVTMNHRLGAFGFLSLDNSTLNVPGNQAFKDQRMALRWVQRNIAYFGGDPERVTLFGHSSGGGSVHYHMISPASRGLFQRAILMAGSALHNGYSKIPRLNWAERLAAEMGFNSTSEAELLQYLENARPEAVVQAQMQLLSLEQVIEDGLVIPFGPTIEPFDTPGVFLDDDIPTLVRNAWGNAIPMMIGGTSKETLELLPFIRAAPVVLDVLSNFENFIPRELNVTRNTDESRRFAANLKSGYYGKMKPSATNVDGILSVFSDLNVWYPAHRTIEYRMRANSAPTYVYRFDADSQNNVIKGLLPRELIMFYRQPAHGDDFAHLFRSQWHRPRAEMNEVSRNTLDLMVGLFTNFATSGNPSMPSRELPHWPSVWPYVGELNNIGDDYLFGLNIQENKTTVGSIPEARRMQLFDERNVNSATSTYAAGFIKIALAVLLKYLIL